MGLEVIKYMLELSLEASARRRKENIPPPSLDETIRILVEAEDVGIE